MTNLSPLELIKFIDSSKSSPILLDVRETWEFEICHIPNSILIPMNTVPYHLDQLDRQKEIVVICHHGIRSRLIANFLEQQGFSPVINLSGGVDLWAEQVDINMAKY